MTATEPNISCLCLTCTYIHTSVKEVGLVEMGGLLRPKVAGSNPARGTKSFMLKIFFHRSFFVMINVYEDRI